MLFICIICCLYSFVSLCTWLSLLVNCSLIFVFVVNTTGLILLALNIIMYLTRNHLVWFRTFITQLLVLLLTCSISRFIVIMDSWNANRIQIHIQIQMHFLLSDYLMWNCTITHFTAAHKQWCSTWDPEPMPCQTAIKCGNKEICVTKFNKNT